MVAGPVLASVVKAAVEAGFVVARRRLSRRGIHIDAEGKITALSGKVDAGQGRARKSPWRPRVLRVPLGSISVLLADTGMTPDDGMTAGSGKTPRTIPSVRQAAAAVNLLIEYAAVRSKMPAETLAVKNGHITRPGLPRCRGYCSATR